MNFTAATDCYTLSNGVKIPCIGYGTFKMADGGDTAEAVLAAIQAGYRHIDTAQTYGNEASVGAALKRSPVPRQELFLTSKLGNNSHGFQATREAFQATLQALDTDYLDLYLIHWPNPLSCRDHWQKALQESWQVMEELYQNGKIRAIGVSNFFPRHFAPLFDSAKILPMVNQISLSPGQPQEELCAYSREHGMLLEAYSPLGQGAMLKTPEILTLCEKYHRSPAQLCVRWSLQKSFLPLPKSTHPGRMAENKDVFDFSISDEDMAILSTIPRESTVRNPDTVAL